MKVLIITGSYPPMKCGVGDYVAKLAEALSSQPNVAVHVLTTGDETITEIEGGVFVWRSVRDWSLKRWRIVARLINSIRPDYVHIQYPTQGYSVGWLPAFIPAIAWACRTKVIQTWHEGCPIPDALLRGLVPGPLIAVRPDFAKNNLHPILQLVLCGRSFNIIKNASSVPRARFNESERLLTRESLLRGQQRLIVFFGFVLPSKGAELLFDIADSKTDQLIFVGEVGNNESSSEIIHRSAASAWKNKVEVRGFAAPETVAELLAAADAVVLPFRNGGGVWNTSIHAAVMQGTFVLTTSRTRHGYLPDENAYFARVDDIDEMKCKLRLFAGRRGSGRSVTSWDSVAQEHLDLYQRVR